MITLKYVFLEISSHRNFFQFEYTDNDLLSRRVYGNGVSTSYTYYPESLKIKEVINALSNGNVLSSFNYTYDKVGRPVSIQTLDGEWSIRYDKASQLTYWESPGHTFSVAYDKNGNRIKTESNGDESGYVVNILNQYTEMKNKQLTYDRNGNLIMEVNDDTGESFQYQFDSENKIVSAVHAGDK